MGFLSGGGGGGQTQVQTIQPPLRTDNAVSGPLGSSAVRQIDSQGAFAPFGSGAALLPKTPMGQIAMPGANPTIFGDPTNTAVQSPYFGSANTTAQQSSPFNVGSTTGMMGLPNSQGVSPAQMQGGGPASGGQGQGGTTPWDLNPQMLHQLLSSNPQMMQQVMGMAQHYMSQQGGGYGGPGTVHTGMTAPGQQPMPPQQPSPQPYYNPQATNYQPNYQASQGAVTPGSGNTAPPVGKPAAATGSGGNSGTK